MSNWGARRQLTFFFFLLLILASVVGVGVWRFWPRPSCTDGRANQDERGVDCGGVCAAVCPDEAVAVRVKWARVLPLGAGIYDVAALVENPNPNFVLANLPFNLRIVDQDNLFITRVAGNLTLAPRESFLIFQTNIDVGRRAPSRALLDFSGPPKWYRGTVKPELTFVDKNFTPDPPLLRAKLVNDSLVAYRGIDVATTVSDGERNTFAASRTTVSEIAPGETREISFSWPRAFTDEAVFIDLYPHVAPSSNNF